MATLEDRFWSKVQKGGPDECWRWTAFCDRQGYGRICEGGRRGAMLNAHRVSWEIHNGPIPSGLCILHRCDNRLCVNPAHLSVGTKADNNQDMANKGRSTRGERHYAAKLTARDVMEIKLYRGPLSQVELGAAYGVSYQHISRIRRGVRWAYLGCGE